PIIAQPRAQREARGKIFPGRENFGKFRFHPGRGYGIIKKTYHEEAGPWVPLRESSKEPTKTYDETAIPPPPPARALPPGRLPAAVPPAGGRLLGRPRLCPGGR